VARNVEKGLVGLLALGVLQEPLEEPLGQGLEAVLSVLRPRGIEAEARLVAVEVPDSKLPQLVRPESGREGHFEEEPPLRRHDREEANEESRRGDRPGGSFVL